MCLIVDANLASLVFAKSPGNDFTPVIDWLTSPKKDGQLVIGGKLRHELDKLENARRFIRVLMQSGRARQVSQQDVENDQQIVISLNQCKSNDHHVIALARVSGARVAERVDALAREIRRLSCGLNGNLAHVEYMVSSLLCSYLDVGSIPTSGLCLNSSIVERDI